MNELTLTKNQQEVFDYILSKETSRVQVKSYRQHGKTTLLVFLAKYFGELFPEYKIGLLLNEYYSVKHQLENNTFPDNVFLLAATHPDKCKGHSFDIMLIDNVGFVDEDVLTTVFLPMAFDAKHIVLTSGLKTNIKGFESFECTELTPFINKDYWNEFSHIIMKDDK